MIRDISYNTASGTFTIDDVVFSCAGVMGLLFSAVDLKDGERLAISKHMDAHGKPQVVIRRLLVEDKIDG